jgi:hypothetical protein
MENLSAVKSALEAEIGNPIAFKSVAVRIFLRTGVNLQEDTSALDADAEKVAEVQSEAREMGYLS